MSLKKVLSLILCLSIISGSIFPLQAYSQYGHKQCETFVLSDSLKMEIIHDKNQSFKTDSIFPLNSNDSERFQIKLYEDGELAQIVEGKYGGDILNVTNFNNSMKSQEIIDLNQRVTKSIEKVYHNEAKMHEIYSNNYGRKIGYITYKPDSLVQDPTVRKVKVYSRMDDKDFESYTINGAVSDTLAVIAGIVLSYLGFFLPGAPIALKIASSIVSGVGGSIVTKTIGVNFSENVAVEASYYTLTAQDMKTKMYSRGLKGISRYVITQKSKSYQNWFHENFTPATWKEEDYLPIYFWDDLFSVYGICPGVERYGL